jgi:DNA-binding Lrp family transcriptional regulator
MIDRTEPGNWTFLTNHSHVLLCIADDPDIRLRDVAEKVGITERAVQRIVAELEDAGYVDHERVGRRNHYQVNSRLPLRHPLEEHLEVEALLRVLTGRDRRAARRRRSTGEA